MSVKVRTRKQGQGKTAVYLDIYFQGKRRFEYNDWFLTGDRLRDKETIKLANLVAAQRQIELQSAPHKVVPDHKKDADFLEYFQGLALTKDKVWRSTLRQLMGYQPTPIPFRRINDEWVEGFKTHLLNKVSTNSANMYFSKLKAAFTLAKRARLIAENPTDFVDGIKKVSTETKHLNESEIETLARSPCRLESVKKAFLFSCFTGLRVSDVKRLTWRQIVGDRIQFRQKKTGELVYVDIGNTARSLLVSRGLPDEPVFKLPASDNAIYDCVRKWGEAAGLAERISFHVSRHSFATLAMSHGVDIYTVSKLLGHSDIKVTQRYAKVIDEKRKEAVNKLPKLNFA